MRSIRPMIKLLKEVKKIDKQKITIPTQIIYSSKDTVVLPSASVENFSEFGSKYKELHEYNESDDPSNHVLAGYILSPKSVEPVLNMMLDFLYKNKIGNKPLKNKPRKSLSVSN
jgi:esterase/lipase